MSGPAGSTLEGVAPSLTYYAGTYSSVSQLAGQTALAGAPAGVGAYAVLASFPGSTDYVAATALTDFDIAQATPTVAVSDAGGAYSGTAFVASATVTGVSGLAGATLEGVAPSLSYYAGTYSSVSQLTGLTAMSGTPVQAGAYTVLASFAGSTDYAAATALANFSIARRLRPSTSAIAGGTYSGTAFVATATVAGVSGPAGASLEGVAPSLSYYVGTYTIAAQLTGLTAAVRGADRCRGLHGPGQLRRQHGLRGGFDAGELPHRAGDADGRRGRCGRDLQRHGLRGLGHGHGRERDMRGPPWKASRRR